MTEYKNPFLTVDAILEKDNSLLMIRRKSDTYDGYLAFPGGFVDYGETVENAIVREVLEELHLRVEPTAILGVYSEKERDPRGHVISVIFICNLEGIPRAGDDAQSYEWVDLNNIEEKKLAFDHSKIIMDYKKWKLNQGTYWSTKATSV